MGTTPTFICSDDNHILRGSNEDMIHSSFDILKTPSKTEKR